MKAVGTKEIIDLRKVQGVNEKHFQEKKQKKLNFPPDIFFTQST